VAIVRARDLFAAAMLFAIYSLLSAALFTVLDAGDVALTEAAVGAGISTILLLAVLALAARYEHPPPEHNWPGAGGGTGDRRRADLRHPGSAGIRRSRQPGSQVHVAPYYTEQSYPDMGVPNMVAAVLASYRSIDTLGEGFVILTAGLAVLRCCRSSRGDVAALRRPTQAGGARSP
jgi:multicomponent Na+:H+ antiporter subunit B